MKSVALANAAALFAALILFAACSRNEQSEPEITSITSVLPLKVKGGDTIRVLGKHLLLGSSQPSININGKPAEVTLATNDSIKAVVPALVGTGSVTVQAGSTTVTGPEITYDYKVTVTTLAGNGSVGTADGIGSEASFYSPWGIAADNKGNLFVADTYNRKIRKISAQTGMVSTYNIPTLPGGRNFFSPYNIAIDTIGHNIFVTDFNKHLMKMDTLGNMQVIYEDSMPITGVAVHPSGNQLYISNNTKGTITRLSMDGSNPTLFTTGLTTPRNIIFSKQGQMYIAAYPAHIYAISTSGIAAAIKNSASFGGWEIAIDTIGNFFLADHFKNCIWIVEKNGKARIIAGSGQAMDADGIGLDAAFDGPQGITIDKYGHLFVTTYNHDRKTGNKVRKIVIE